jgi:hypothetical protein
VRVLFFFLLGRESNKKKTLIPAFSRKREKEQMGEND